MTRSIIEMSGDIANKDSTEHILSYRELHEIRCPHGCEDKPIRWKKYPYAYPRVYSGECSCSVYTVVNHWCKVMEISIPEPLLKAGQTKRKGNNIYGINEVKFDSHRGWVYCATNIGGHNNEELTELDILGADGYRQRIKNLDIRVKSMPYLETLRMFPDWVYDKGSYPRTYYRHDIELGKSYSMTVDAIKLVITPKGKPQYLVGDRILVKQPVHTLSKKLTLIGRVQEVFYNKIAGWAYIITDDVGMRHTVYQRDIYIPPSKSEARRLSIQRDVVFRGLD